MILFRSRSQRGQGRKHRTKISRPGRKRKVTLDSNVLFSALGLKSRYPRRALEKSLRSDKLKHTDTIQNELLNHKYKNNRKERKIKNEVEKGLKGLPDPEIIKPIKNEELANRYPKVNEKDRKIVHSAKCTKSELLVSGDKRLIGEAKSMGLNAATPKDYVNEKKKRLSRRNK